MPLVKAKGNMYPWVSHMHAHLEGQCPHKCPYCYAQDIEKRHPTGRYVGNVRLKEKEFAVQYGSDKTIFIEHTNDLFASTVPTEWIERIVSHCNTYPHNTYVFQTKNPARYLELSTFQYPKNCIFGTTIETNRDLDNPNVPQPHSRYYAMKQLLLPTDRKFITVEPVLDFDVNELAEWIGEIKPEFLNLGADSKGHNLVEPTVEKIMQLVEKLKEYGIELREKHNLDRLLKRKGK